MTPLNDILINFKKKGTFIICEIQLILVDLLEESDIKLKIMEDLNHTIYQMERSPYGSISEMAMIIGYNDPSIEYESKIEFASDWPLKNKC